MNVETLASSQQIQVEAQADHLDSIAKSKPINALTELIWNALDADADRVEVTFCETELGGPESIQIIDNGDGLPLSEAESAFGKLGGSWKKGAVKSRRKGRGLHGRDGKGRFKAFALGASVTWDTVYLHEGKPVQYSISGTRGNLKTFTIGQSEDAGGQHTGTQVTIENLQEKLPGLSKKGSALDFLSEQFAIYLRDNPGLKIIYRGSKVEPSRVQKAHKVINMYDINIGDGRLVTAVLEIFEWTTIRKERKIRLCDERGFPLHEIEAGVRPGPSYNFTAYLRSSYINELHRDNTLEMGEQCGGLKILLDHARDGLRGYFRERKAASASDVVKQWKDDGIYPYDCDSENPLDKARREVFDICAINVHEYLESFRQGNLKEQQFTLLMLKTTLEENPPALKHILTTVLGLSKERQKDLSELLEHQSLPAIIEASRVVTDRLSFLAGFEKLLFDPESKKTLQERSQLHHILENETWIFGEEFFLSESEVKLTTVLRKHLSILRPKAQGGRKKGKKEELLLDDGGDGRIDLMLAREIPSYGRNQKEYLVVELKRPLQKIDLKIKAQIEAYALAVVRDEQIDFKNTHWTFLAVSNEITDDALETIEQTDKPYGVFLRKDTYTVGLASWAEVIQACRTRLEMFNESLGKSVDGNRGIEFLNAKYKKYLPACLKVE